MEKHPNAEWIRLCRMTNDDIKKALGEIASIVDHGDNGSHDGGVRAMRNAVEQWLTAPGGLATQVQSMRAAIHDVLLCDAYSDNAGDWERAFKALQASVEVEPLPARKKVAR